MRTLEDIRNANKRKDLLFVGMEKKSVQPSHEEYENGRKEYKKILEAADKTWAKYGI